MVRIPPENLQNPTVPNPPDTPPPRNSQRKKFLDIVQADFLQS